MLTKRLRIILSFVKTHIFLMITERMEKFHWTTPDGNFFSSLGQANSLLLDTISFQIFFLIITSALPQPLLALNKAEAVNLWTRSTYVIIMKLFNNFFCVAFFLTGPAPVKVRREIWKRKKVQKNRKQWKENVKDDNGGLYFGAIHRRNNSHFCGIIMEAVLCSSFSSPSVPQHSCLSL